MIARKSFLIISTHFFTDFLGWIGIVILAKLWGGFAPEALGTIGFAMSFISLFSIITDLGFSHAHIKRVSEGKDLGTCIGTFAAVKLFLTGLMVLIVFVFIFIWKNVLNEGFTDATTESVVIVIVIHAIFSNLRNIALNTFTGKGEIAKLQITKMTENLVKVPLTILVALAGVTIVGGANISPAVTWPQFLQPLQQFIAIHAIGSLAMTYVFGIAATFFVGIWFMRRFPLKKPSWDFSKSYFFFAIPIMISSVISTVSTNVDKVMIGYFWTSTEVGYYFTVQRILGFIIIFSGAVGTVAFPAISKYHSAKNFQGIKQVTRRSERYISMVMIPPIALVVVFRETIIDIMLNSAFLPAAPVLVTLMVWAYVRGLTAPYSNLISGMNRPSILAIFAAVVCTINIGLNYLIIPKEGVLSNFGITGPTGAAFSTVLSASIAFFGLRIAAKRMTGIKLFQSHIPRHIIAGFVMGVALYYLAYQTSLFPIIHWYHLLGFAGMGLAVYLAVLFLLKEFKKQDLHFFLKVLSPKEMIGYVKSEVKGKNEK